MKERALKGMRGDLWAAWGREMGERMGQPRADLLARLADRRYARTCPNPSPIPFLCQLPPDLGPRQEPPLPCPEALPHGGHPLHRLQTLKM